MKRRKPLSQRLKYRDKAMSQAQQIHVDTVSIPMGVQIPWELDDENKPYLIYEIVLQSGLANSTCRIEASLGMLILEEISGDRAMMIPLNLVCGIGKKSSILSVQKM